jgi:serine/threonine-protein phosphatase 2B catalytic subunit
MRTSPLPPPPSPSLTTNSRHADLANERLPTYTPSSHPYPSVPAPSMRRAETLDMDLLIRKTLEDEGEESGEAERIAERISSKRGRKVSGGRLSPRGMKRFGTA